MKHVTVAPTDAVEVYATTAVEFMSAVLGLAPGDYAISDESRLSDFSSCGLPDELADATANLSELYAAWDTWVVAEVERRYGLPGMRSTVPLTELFELIEQHRRTPVQ